MMQNEIAERQQCSYMASLFYSFGLIGIVMAETIIGREDEKKTLKEMLISKEAELIAILERHRIHRSLSLAIYTQKGGNGSTD